MFVRKSKSGFTLVEILIVVIILGILAAIVIPQFTNASQDARKSSLTSQLQTLRSQIELYKLQHGDTLPDLTGAAPLNWNLLMTVTSYNGKNFGPYMQAAPINPLNGQSAVIDGTIDTSAVPWTVATGTVAADTGFIYDYNGAAGTGRIYGTDVNGGAPSGVYTEQ
jgi:general secretion pathway protein G